MARLRSGGAADKAANEAAHEAADKARDPALRWIRPRRRSRRSAFARAVKVRGDQVMDVLLPIVAAVAFVLGLISIGPAWHARFGASTPGTFTAQHESCGRRTSCSWSGTFTPSDGSPVREDVSMGSGGPFLHAGQDTPAIDTGDPHHVFPPGGGHDWIWIPLVLLGSAGYLAFTGWEVLDWWRRRRR